MPLTVAVDGCSRQRLDARQRSIKRDIASTDGGVVFRHRQLCTKPRMLAPHSSHQSSGESYVRREPREA